MRVLIVDQLSKRTGHDSFMFAKKLRAHGLDVELVIGEYSNDEFSLANYKIFNNVFTGNFFKKTINYLFALSKLKKIIKNGKYDIVYLQWFILPWLEPVFVKKIKKYCRVIINVHDPIPFYIRPFEIHSLKKIYNYSNGIILLNENAKKVFVENYKVNVPVFVTTSAFCDKDEFHLISKEEARSFFNLPNDRYVVLYYGSIRDSKGLDLLIEAFSVAHKKNDKLFLLIGGAFLKNDEKKKYLELVSKYLKDSNSFARFEFIPDCDENKFFCASDVICLPYKTGFQSGVAQLALMYEKPIIVSNTGDLSDCVSGNGFIISPNSVEEITEALLKIVDKDQNEMSLNSKKLGENDFSLDNRVKLTIEVFNNILK